MNQSNVNSIEMSHAQHLFKARYEDECRRVNRFMSWLMIGQWIAGICFAVFYSPLTWIGESYEIHTHIWIATVMGGAISSLAIFWIRFFPVAVSTRNVVAICQVLWSALLIHLTGGRIETHFHVFASLAILSLYRDWKILLTATGVVAIDHAIRGMFFPLSAFGVITESPYRWIEHAAWVLFEVSFLAPGCAMLRNEIFALCEQQTQIEEAKRSVDEKVAQATSELVQSNELLAAKTREAETLALVAKYTDNAVIITDENGGIEWVNEGFERITGFTMKEAVGHRAVDLLDGPKVDGKLKQKVRKAIENHASYDLEMLRYRKSGEPFWMSIEARRIVDDNAQTSRYILVESDITERVNSEIERQRLNDQLIEASRTAGLAEAATGVLHNVGNVLNSVNVSATLIERQIRRSAFEKLEKVANLLEENERDFREFVNEDRRGELIPAYITQVTDALKNERESVSNEFKDLLNNIEHIKEIVSLQQDVAKSKGIRQQISIDQVIDQALSANKGSLTNHNVSIEKNIESNLPEIVSDKHKVIQILINLIKNAKDAELAAEDGQKSIVISATESNESVSIEIKDSGIGIAKENLSKIFRHGFTTKPTGHGFGLHSCANFAKELGGSLTVQSDGLGLGATFRLTLPVECPQTQEVQSV